MAAIYKIVEEQVWRRLVPGRRWAGTPLDERDGFVHLSAAGQVAGTLDKHYRGRDGLLLLEVPESALPRGDLRWEESRGGQLFPHLYGGLDPSWVTAASALARGPDGRHVLPAGLAP